MSAPEIFAWRMSSCARSRLPLWLMPISAMMIIQDSETQLEVIGGQNPAQVTEIRAPRLEFEEVAAPVDRQPAAVIAIDVAGDLRRVVLALIGGEVLAHAVEAIDEPFLDSEPGRQEPPYDLERRSGKRQVQRIVHPEAFEPLAEPLEHRPRH